ncbi:hypothetical protein B0H13DRAFT_1929101 [Mycena leptocephala]|nr:hypothetical protein B0H13DRAFT_1929101 [Mycena leptocephala]
MIIVRLGSTLSRFLRNVCTVVVDAMHFELQIFAAAGDVPKGYLFLCPAKNLQVRPSSFVWPSLPAYWSLDPLGAQFLSTRQAVELGFPDILIRAPGTFNQAKGFDPGSQEVAQHLGHPLYQVCICMETASVVPFSHVEEEEYPSAHCDEDMGDKSGYPEDFADDPPVLNDVLENRAASLSVHHGMRILIEDSIWLTILTYPDSETVSESTDGHEQFKLHDFREEMPAVSRTFKFTMHIQSDYSPT